MPQAKKTEHEHSSELAEHLERARAATPGSGWASIVHSLELAFVHALAGAEDEARRLIADAETEFETFKAGLSHLGVEFSLAVARVLAVIEGK